MGVTAQDVKKLREMTGAGMMDCKKALVETDGDIDQALEFLQKKGMAKAKKKAGRTAAEGLVHVWQNADQSAAAMVEINSETDFVARNDQFISFVQTVTDAIGESGAASLDEAMDKVTIDGHGLDDYVTAHIATIGENIKVRRVQRFEGDAVASYIHFGGKIGVLVNLSGDGAQAQTLGEDVAMHIAAMKPEYLSPDEVDDAAAAKQAEIFEAQLVEQGKQANIIPRIMEGKMRKWREESSLLKQAFVKDTDKTVEQYQGDFADAAITGFARFEVGEGIEKEESNLADEVAQALK